MLMDKVIKRRHVKLICMTRTRDGQGRTGADRGGRVVYIECRKQVVDMNPSRFHMSDVRRDHSNKGVNAAGWLSLLDLTAECILNDPDLGELPFDN